METKSKHTCLTHAEAGGLFTPIDPCSGHAFGHKLQARMDSIRALVKKSKENCKECRKDKKE